MTREEFAKFKPLFEAHVAKVIGGPDECFGEPVTRLSPSTLSPEDRVHLKLLRELDIVERSNCMNPTREEVIRPNEDQNSPQSGQQRRLGILNQPSEGAVPEAAPYSLPVELL